MYKKTKIALVTMVIVFLSLAKISGAPNFYPNEDDYKEAIDKTPTPSGGYEGILKKIIYPTMAFQTRTEGKVYLLVYLSENGDVEDAKIVKGIGGWCDEEALKAVKKTKVTPATQNGALVKTKFAIAISFKLP